MECGWEKGRRGKRWRGCEENEDLGGWGGWAIAGDRYVLFHSKAAEWPEKAGSRRSAFRGAVGICFAFAMLVLLVRGESCGRNKAAGRVRVSSPRKSGGVELGSFSGHCWGPEATEQVSFKPRGVGERENKSLDRPMQRSGMAQRAVVILLAFLRSPLSWETSESREPDGPSVGEAVSRRDSWPQSLGQGLRFLDTVEPWLAA
jgi:hypothetical protein